MYFIIIYLWLSILLGFVDVVGATNKRCLIELKLKKNIKREKKLEVPLIVHSEVDEMYCEIHFEVGNKQIKYNLLFKRKNTKIPIEEI